MHNFSSVFSLKFPCSPFVTSDEMFGWSKQHTISTFPSLWHDVTPSPRAIGWKKHKSWNTQFIMFTRNGANAFVETDFNTGAQSVLVMSTFAKGCGNLAKWSTRPCGFAIAIASKIEWFTHETIKNSRFLLGIACHFYLMVRSTFALSSNRFTSREMCIKNFQIKGLAVPQDPSRDS